MVAATGFSMDETMRRRVLTAVGLLLIDLGVFAATCACLPPATSYGWRGAWSHFVNSRVRWDIAWGALVASLLVSAGVFLLMEALGVFRRGPKAIEPADTDDAVSSRKQS
jgi:hypothetical protein